MSRLVIVVVLCCQTMAQAQQQPEALTQARAHFDAGRTLYDAGAYAEALREFNIGYELSHKPRFLLNIAQTHRKLNDFGRAREAVKKFLDETPPGDPYRSTAEALLKELETAENRPPAPSPAPAPPAPEPATPPAPEPTVTPPHALVATPAPPRKPLARRGWLWGTVVGGVVVIGGAIALGVVLGSSSQYPSGLKVPVQ